MEVAPETEEAPEWGSADIGASPEEQPSADTGAIPEAQPSADIGAGAAVAQPLEERAVSELDRRPLEPLTAPAIAVTVNRAWLADVKASPVFAAPADPGLVEIRRRPPSPSPGGFGVPVVYGPPEQYSQYDYRKGHSDGPASIDEAWEEADRENPAGLMIVPYGHRSPDEAPGAREIYEKDLNLWLNTRVPIMPKIAVNEFFGLKATRRMKSWCNDFVMLLITVASLFTRTRLGSKRLLSTLRKRGPTTNSWPSKSQLPKRRNRVPLAAQRQFF